MSEIEKKYTVVNDNVDKATRIYNQQFKGITRLGKEIKISPKSACTVNTPGFKVEFFTPTVSICIGIGNDHTADLIMTLDAWKALNQGHEININTTKEFSKKFKVDTFKDNS